METDVLVTGVCCSRENPTLSPFEDTFHILPLCESQLIIPAVIKKKKKMNFRDPISGEQWLSGELPTSMYNLQPDITLRKRFNKFV